MVPEAVLAHEGLDKRRQPKRGTLMVRKIIKIDAEKCNACGACVDACHEGAIGLRQGKAVLLRDDYCDGLGNCLPACPTGAISFEEREALAYDEAAVLAHMPERHQPAALGCPGSQARLLSWEAFAAASPACAGHAEVSALRQWPLQMKLVPANAAFFDGANLLIAADCAAYAHANFHAAFMRGKVTLIGCPKLDATDYSVKLAEIFCSQAVNSVTVVRMSVPCCAGLEHAVGSALRESAKDIPLSCAVLSTTGAVVES